MPYNRLNTLKNRNRKGMWIGNYAKDSDYLENTNTKTPKREKTKHYPRGEFPLDGWKPVSTWLDASISSF